MSVRVEWYLSENQAVGVNTISDDWVPRDIGQKATTGFKNNWDPDHEPHYHIPFREEDDRG